MTEKLTQDPVAPPPPGEGPGGFPPGGGGSSPAGGPQQQPGQAGPGGGPGAAVLRGGFTGKDDFDGHVHAVISLDGDSGTGVTESVGGPGTGIRAHGHAIVGFQVLPYEAAGYISVHSSAPLQSDVDSDDTKELERASEAVTKATASAVVERPGTKKGTATQ